MTDNPTLRGAVENGSQGIAAFPFYAGPVGIRQRDGWTDVAFFSPPLRVKALPLRGTLDGVDVIVTALRARDMNGDAPAKPTDLTPRVIVASVTPVS